jgi:hypothetical protein
LKSTQENENLMTQLLIHDNYPEYSRTDDEVDFEKPIDRGKREYDENCNGKKKKRKRSKFKELSCFGITEAISLSEEKNSNERSKIDEFVHDKFVINVNTEANINQLKGDSYPLEGNNNEAIYEEEKVNLVNVNDDSLNSFCNEPDERRQESSGCERDARTFNQSSAVGESDGAAENNVLNKVQNGRQSSVAECTNCSVIGSTSSTSGTNPISNAEEVIFGKGYGRFFDIREYYSINTGSLRRCLKKVNVGSYLIDSSNLEIIKSKSLRRYNSDCECEAQAIYHSPAVYGSGVAAEIDYSLSKRICRQDQAVECTNTFVNGTICLTSETNP